MVLAKSRQGVVVIAAVEPFRFRWCRLSLYVDDTDMRKNIRWLFVLLYKGFNGFREKLRKLRVRVYTLTRMVGCGLYGMGNEFTSHGEKY